MGTVQIVIILAMLAVNSLFAGYELALASVSLGRLRGLAEQGRRSAGAALAMKGRMEASLAVVQIGMTLASAIAAATGGAGAGESLAPWIEEAFGASHALGYVLAIALVVIPLSAVMIVLGELVPKTLGIKHPEWVCLTLSPVMRVAAWVFYPAVLAFEAITRFIVRLVERRMPESMGRPYEIGLAELRTQTYALRSGRIIGAEQERIILGASNLSTTKVKDILVAPGEIVMLNADAPLTDHFVIVHLEAYTRFPVTETPGDPQGIIGYVNLKELIFLAKMFPTNPSIRQITRRLVEVAPDANVGDAFARMMREHAHLALVRDADGRVGGIITLEDILEEVVGDIQDEFDRIPRHIT
ncbi:MAG: CNNM domain-containing protein, partial [Planctomycetota bacterium]|nr:CNNM domain-containing protein [Planctomycetota bacterium]